MFLAKLEARRALLERSRGKAEASVDKPAAPVEWMIVGERRVLKSVHLKTLDRWKRAQAAKRAREKAEPVAPVRLSSEEKRQIVVAFDCWVKIDGPRQRQHKSDPRRYQKGYCLLVGLRRAGAKATPAAFAKWFTERTREPMGAEDAKRLLRALARLEAADGPWPKTDDEKRGTLSA